MTALYSTVLNTHINPPFSLTRPTGPIQSLTCNFRLLSLCVSVCLCHWINFFYCLPLSASLSGNDGFGPLIDLGISWLILVHVSLLILFDHWYFWLNCVNLSLILFILVYIGYYWIMVARGVDKKIHVNIVSVLKFDTENIHFINTECV